MTVGVFIQWLAPYHVPYFMSQLATVWFEECCFNQYLLAEVLMIDIEYLHAYFENYEDEQNKMAE